jgi:hypothetical protein
MTLRGALILASYGAAAARTLLALAPDALASATNATIAPGEPELLVSYVGGIGGGSYAGWAYPSVVRGSLANGSDGFLMLYSACACASAGCWGRQPLYTFLAESADGVAWAPVAVPSAPPGAPPGALFESSEVGAVVDDAGGAGVGPGERYKLLRPDKTIQVSDDARKWLRWRYNWTAAAVDPGFHALRPARGGAAVIVTARPQALRKLGRHAGVIAAADGWAGLGAQLAAATQPLDSLLYRFTDQIYGLPAFDYAAVLAADAAGLPAALTADAAGGNFVAFVWRLLAPNGETGWVTSALAFSHDAQSWAPAPSAPVNVSLLATGVDLPGATYRDVFGAWPSLAAGAAACNAACRNDTSSCAAWAYVSSAAARGAERCSLKRDVSAPEPAHGIVSGARSDLGAGGSAPLAALRPLFALPTAPSAISYRQFYPKTVLAVGGRLLVYASVSSTLHGDSAPNASGIEVYALRADGLAAATGPPAGAGTVVTAPLAWASGEAALNVLCGGGGGVRVAALQGGAPLPGYALADADPAPRGCDALVWAPSWGGGARGLAALAGTTLQLQIELAAGAKFFALRGDFALAPAQAAGDAAAGPQAAEDAATGPQAAGDAAAGQAQAAAAAAPAAPVADLLIYGSTPAGVAAAVAFRAAAGPAATITMLDPGSRVGGMSSSGLGNSDVRTVEVVGGFARDFFVRNAREYDSNASAPLFLLEPHVAERLFLATLADAGAALVSGVQGIAAVAREGAAVVSVTTASGATYAARYFIDASYEGDVVGAAGLAFALGREPRAQYGEARAGRLGGNFSFTLPISPYDESGALLPLMSTAPFAAEGDGDGLLQSYCFRLCVTNISALRRPFPAPAAFVPRDYELFRRWVAANPPSLSSFFGYAFRIPGGDGACCKFDLNSDFAVSFDFVGGSARWPIANASERRAIWEAHRQYTLGLIHVLQFDPDTPPAVRAEAQRWGLCADEFGETGGWPPQLYVREGRRMVGDAVFTGVQLDTGVAPRGDSVGLGSYATDVHHVERVPCVAHSPLPAGPFPGPFPQHAVTCDMLQPGARAPPNATVWVATEGHGGDIRAPDAVFEMPFSLLLPQRAQATNVLAPTAPSASHVAFNSIRMEAQFMILGQAAGAAAALALGARGAVQDVPVPALQAELARQGARLHWGAE